MRQLSRAPLEDTAYSLILLYKVFLEIITKLGRKGDRSEVKTFFFKITMILGEKREMRDQSPFLFREHQVLEILVSGP